MSPTIADTPVDVDGEGFLTHPEQWTEEIAKEMAQENGIPVLTERHWLVVRFMRERFLSTGTAPTIRSLGKESGVPVKELYQLFPKGPAKLAAKIGGIPALTERHWLVVRFMRERFLSTGTAPSIRSLGKESGVPVKELYELFPKGPAKLAAKIGGIPKPRGCI